MRTTEGEEDTPLTVEILFSLDRCLLMGDWCRQVGTTRSETDTDKPKETTAKGKIGMTLLICFAYSDANDGRGRRYSSYGRNTFFS